MALLCFLITCSAEDVWNEEEIQNITKKQKKKQTEKRPDQTQSGWKMYCECSISLFSLFSFFKNEGKCFVSQNNFKNISGSC